MNRATQFHATLYAAVDARRQARRYVLAVLLGFILATVVASVAQAQQAGSLPGAVFVQAVEHPPALWERIYKEVEKCVGKRGKFKAVKWYVTAQPWMDSTTGKTYGMWRIANGKPSIIVAHGDTGVVRHESLHDILWANGFRPIHLSWDNSTNPEHPMPPFGKCAERFAN
jgi:hypothetical protein